MSEQTDHTQRIAELQHQLNELQNLLKGFTDFEQYPASATMYWLGCAIISLQGTEAFTTLTGETASEASALLQDHFTATYRLLEYLELGAA